MKYIDEELQRKIEFAREKQRQLRIELKSKMDIDDFSDLMASYEQDRYDSIKKYREEEAAKYENKIHETMDEDIVRCPRCGSTQIAANKKGFGFGKAAAGGLLLGPVGLLGGFMGSNKVLITCLKCGCQWKP